MHDTPGFWVVVSRPADHVLLTLHGELDLHTAPALERPLADLLASGAPQVLLDARHLRFIDSSGLAVILHAVEAWADRGGVVRIVHPSRQTSRLLDIAGCAGLVAAG